MISYNYYLVLWFTVAIPALVGMAFYSKLSQPIRLIVLLMITGLISEICLVIAARNNTNNLYIATIYSFVEVALLTLYFFQIIVNPKAKRIIVLLGTIVMILIVLEIVISSVSGWNSVSLVAESIMVIGFGLCFYYEVGTYTNPSSTKTHSFWITGVITFYFMSSLEYFLLGRYLTKASYNSLILLADVHTLVNAFCNLAYAFILWKFTRSYSLVR